MREFLLVDVKDENAIVFLEEVPRKGTTDTTGASADDNCFRHFVRGLMLE